MECTLTPPKTVHREIVRSMCAGGCPALRMAGRLAAVASMLRGGHPGTLGRDRTEAIDLGLAGAGEVAMAEAGAGLDNSY